MTSPNIGCYSPNMETSQNPWAAGTTYGHWRIENPTFIDARILATCTACNKTTKPVRRTALKNGQTTTCGCQRTTRHAGKTWKTLPTTTRHGDPQIGDVIGRLTITSKPKPGHNRTITAQCSCNGNQRDYVISHLGKAIKSCGCLKTEGITTLNRQ